MWNNPQGTLVRAKASCGISVSINKVLLAHACAHSFMHGLQLLLTRTAVPPYLWLCLPRFQLPAVNYGRKPLNGKFQKEFVSFKLRTVLRTWCHLVPPHSTPPGTWAAPSAGTCTLDLPAPIPRRSPRGHLSSQMDGASVTFPVLNHAIVTCLLL